MAADAPPAWPDDALEVGRIGDAWGLKGAFRVLAYADPPLALLAATRWYLRRGDDPRSAVVPIPPLLEIADVRVRGEAYVASSPAVTDRTAAEALRGARVFISRSEFPEPATDEFYWADLIGATVTNRAGATLGTVVDLLDNGAQSVLRVAPAAAGADELLIPFVSAYVDAVDLAMRRIVVDWQLGY